MQKKDWTDEWDQTNQIPKLIRVAITTQNPSQPFDRGEQYVRIVAPACAAVQAPWQAAPPGGGQRPPGLGGGNNTKVGK